jgi:cell shape-determining protein MreC
MTLLRIFLILAIIAGLGSGGVAYYEWSTQIPAIEKQRDDSRASYHSEVNAHNKTKAELKQTKADLAQTQQELADTKSDLTKMTARADAQEKRADDLQDKLTKSQSDLQDAQNQLAEYKASGLTPDEVVKLNKDLIEAERKIVGITGERDLWNRRYVATKARLDKYEGDTHFVELKPSLKGSVVVVDPKWDFVVLNIGEDDGAIQEGEMLVSRDGKLVAKVVITSVQKNRCIANIVPGWKLGDVIEGDVVTPAHPASS